MLYELEAVERNQKTEKGYEFFAVCILHLYRYLEIEI
jgi:hypothetical protein